MICCIWSGLRFDGRGGAASVSFVSGLGVDVDGIVFLLVGAASVSSELELSSALSVVELAALGC